MTLHIRLLRAGDEALLANVAPGVFDHPVDSTASAAFLADPRHHLAVALEGGQVVGFASAVHYFHPDKPAPELFVNEVGVSPEQQRHGIGKNLLNALFDHGRALGCVEAWVLTDRNNTPALALYSACGGSEAAEEQVMVSFRLG